MSRNVRVLKCTPEDVFEVLSDGWLYPSWVVGASRMRKVDDRWPSAGAEAHHSFGVWPVLIDDKTVVEEFVPPRKMVMRARGWPIGEARVTIDVKPRGAECVVRIQEEAVAGPGRYIPAPLLDVALHWRNDETLHRLAYLAEGTATRRIAASTAEKEMAASGEDVSDTTPPPAGTASHEPASHEAPEPPAYASPLSGAGESEPVGLKTDGAATEAGVPAGSVPPASTASPPKKSAPRSRPAPGPQLPADDTTQSEAPSP